MQLARAQPNATALFHGDRTTHYATLDRHVRRVANVLAALGVGRGDRIAYLGKNSDLYYELLLGAARMGAVMVPLNWRLAPAELVAIVADGQMRRWLPARDLAL
jgi:acyl-CoA synthetase (AMP-forming)/AMP-acid ligase II